MVLLAAGSLMTRRDLYWEMMEFCFATLVRALFSMVNNSLLFLADISYLSMPQVVSAASFNCLYSFMIVL